jgi:hypothetical protein
MNYDEKAVVAREQSRRFASDSALRRRVAMADYGLSLKWVVEWQGRIVASLSEPASMDDDWTSFKISPLTSNIGVLQLMEFAAFWMHPDLVFRNAELALVAIRAVGAGEAPSNGRVSIQHLFFDFDLLFADWVHVRWKQFQASRQRKRV